MGNGRLLELLVEAEGPKVTKALGVRIVVMQHWFEDFTRKAARGAEGTR